MKLQRAVEQTTNQAQAMRRNRAGQPLEVLELPDALLRLETFSQASGLSIATIYRRAKAGEIELVKMGKRCTRIRASVARAFIQAQGCA